MALTRYPNAEVKRPEVCNNLRVEVLLWTTVVGELEEMDGGDFCRQSVEVNSTSPSLR